ncbi:hypothetical protein LWM68_40995 [Niabella sp. W65]|nr:hypothetical protein [Niabella sp. W65]MCH7368551.1 hypothetical protein [Niabella sp. W65]ULT44140.1 hypothetical protein KRR40_12690 [Niabella sp. I65]
MEARKANGNYYVFACVNELAIQRSFGIIEITSLGSGNDAEYMYDRKRNWSATLGGICVLTDLVANSWTLDEIAAIPDTFTALDVRFTLTDTAAAAMVWSGRVLFPDFGITANMQDGGEPAMWNCKLQGTGGLLMNGIAPMGNYMLYEDEGKIILE